MHLIEIKRRAMLGPPNRNRAAVSQTLMIFTMRFKALKSDGLRV